MSHSVTRQKKAAAWRKCWSTLASRHASASPSDPCAKKERERSDRAAATRARKAVQARIVEAFRKYVRGAGNGPTDEDLLTFAKVAIAEQRLRRRLGLHKSFGKGSSRGF
jgi:hypothetical protein